MNCIFCKIINNEVPSYKIYEDEIVCAFLDANPDSNGHILIVPKEHFQDIDDIPSNVLNHIMNIAKKIKILLYERLNCDGLTLMQNNGVVQEVKHFHLHLKPYYKNSQKLSLEDVNNLLK